MYRYYIIILLLYSVVTCINIDSWNPFKRFRHFWQTINNHENESLPFNFQKNKLQSLNVQNISNHGDREKRRKFKIYFFLIIYIYIKFNRIILFVHLVFPLFTLIKFNNNACVGLNGENGTCIAATECSQRSGISSGICANGYGICCIGTFLFII